MQKLQTVKGTKDLFGQVAVDHEHIYDVFIQICEFLNFQKIFTPIIEYSDVFKIIENKINYPNVFRRISKIKLYEDDIIHIHLNMPFPFSKRDYIVKYELVNKQNYSEFYFHSVKHPKSIRPKDSVLLPNAGGKWIIKKISHDKTKVTYIWNGQLLGDFPDWAMTKAWKKQGEEVLEWLNISLNNTRY